MTSCISYFLLSLLLLLALKADYKWLRNTTGINKAFCCGVITFVVAVIDPAAGKGYHADTHKLGVLVWPSMLSVTRSHDVANGLGGSVGEPSRHTTLPAVKKTSTHKATRFRHQQRQHPSTITRVAYPYNSPPLHILIMSSNSDTTQPPMPASSRRSAADPNRRIPVLKRQNATLREGALTINRRTACGYGGMSNQSWQDAMHEQTGSNQV
jgi:hypothetical protein